MSTPLQEQRASRMGYATAARKPAAPAPTSRAAAAGKIYGNIYANAISSFYDRNEARYRFKGDTENLEIARRERVQIAEFARARGMSPQDLHAALEVVHDHDINPRSREAIEARRPITKEALRLQEQGSEGKDKLLARAIAFETALGQAIPTLAARAAASGAAEHLTILSIGARYADPVAIKE